MLVSVFNGWPFTKHSNHTNDYTSSGMSAEAIKSIELIKNSPARYYAAGTAGLANIVTKKANLKGTSGYLSQGFSQGKRSREGTGVGFKLQEQQVKFIQ